MAITYEYSNEMDTEKYNCIKILATHFTVSFLLCVCNMKKFTHCVSTNKIVLNYYVQYSSKFS